MTDRVLQLQTVQEEARELFRKKNADYGDAFATYGTVGVLVRLGDKIKRLQSITAKSVSLVEDEKMRDTLIDLHNYAAMGIMLLDEVEEENKGVSEEENKEVSEGESEEESNGYDMELYIESDTKWTIVGDSGKNYQRRCFKYSDGSILDTCSCPSYLYCNKKKPTCKHIDKDRS